MVAEDRPQLIYISDEENGIIRRRCGKGFTYHLSTGERITDEATLVWLKALVIPPAWTNVWICPEQNGHLLATGRDEKGRKQYIYHPDWMAFQQASKFQKMVRFAEMLPHIRRQLAQDLRKRGWVRERVLALAVSLLDECGMRIGNQQYVEANGTYGLTTLRRKHLEIDRNGIHFSYKGKSGQYREVEIEDRKLTRLVKDLCGLPGYEVFRYQGEDGKYHNIDSADVNEYIRQIAGEEFSSKDFRTWAATTAAVEFFPLALEEVAENPRRKLDVALVRLVADFIGNTLAVCRKYYIHPAIMARVEAGDIPSLESVTEQQLAAFDGELDPSEIIAYEIIRDSSSDI